MYRLSGPLPPRGRFRRSPPLHDRRAGLLPALLAGVELSVRDLEALGYLNYLCYELGIDPIEMGNTLAMLAEATELGLTPNGLRWGDADRMIELIELTGRGEGIGGVLALGASAAANRFGALTSPCP